MHVRLVFQPCVVIGVSNTGSRAVVLSALLTTPISDFSPFISGILCPLNSMTERVMGF